MDIKEINDFIDWEVARLDEHYKDKDEKEILLANTIKIGEELGELYNEVLAHKGFQRKDKLDKMDVKEIEKEIADVILTTFILARRFNINIENALNTKIEKIKSRDYNK